MSDLSHHSLPPHGKGAWRTYTTADGLAGLQVEHIVEDQEGYLWFATASGGVSRFDGDEFQTYTTRDGLCSDLVHGLLCDRQGHLWFGTLDRGVCRYDGQAFHHFGEDDWAPRRHCSYLFEDAEGRIWASGQNDLGYHDGTGWRDLTPEYRQACKHEPGACWGIAQDANGHLWFGSNHALVRFDGSCFHRYGKEYGLAEEGGSFGVAVDAEGAVWTGRAGRIWRYDGGTFHPVPAEFDGHVRKIQTDREGRIWVCLGGGGALCHDGAAWHRYTTRDGLPSDTVCGMLQGREGLFWFATWGGGVSCCDAHSIHLGEEEGLPHNQVYTLTERRRGGIWMGFSALLPARRRDRAIGVWDDGEFSALAAEGQPELNTGGCQALCQSRAGHLWIGSARGLFRYAGGALHKVFPEAESEDRWVTAISEDDTGHLFFGHRGSQPHGNPCITCFDGSRFRQAYEEEGRSFGSINALISARDQGLWFARGVTMAQPEGRGVGRLCRSGEVSFWSSEDGLADDRVEDLFVDRDGVLWLATLGGISRFDGNEFRSFTIADGLPNNHVRCVCEDHGGHLWFGTDGGVAVYDGSVFQTVRVGHVSPTTHIIEDRERRLWFATQSGAVRYTPSRVPPRVRMVQVIADQVYREPEEVEASTATRQMSFEYKGMSFRTHPRDLRYVCRLQGYEEEWQPATGSRRALYQDLPTGQYTFQVKGIDRDLNYSEEAAAQVTVMPDAREAGLTDALRESVSAGEFVGRSAALRQVQTQLRQVAPSDMTVLILGETGTGKGLAARVLHDLSPRRDKPFIQVNCGSVPVSLAESELFGHERGAFTGAVSRRLGKVELAGGGTLFLDEAADMPLEAQVKLLRLLEERTFERVGGAEVLTAEVRVVAATNRNLSQQVESGEFRADLYYRLQGFELRLPPLRERREDVPLLALYFMQPAATHLGKPAADLAPEALASLQAYDWPGNVRELQHAVERAVVVCDGPTIRAGDLALIEAPEGATPAGERVTLEEHERRYIRAVLEDTGGVISGPHGAAIILGLPESTLRTRMKRLGIERP